VFSFLVGSARAWKDRFLDDVIVSILYFIIPSARLTTIVKNLKT